VELLEGAKASLVLEDASFSYKLDKKDGKEKDKGRDGKGEDKGRDGATGDDTVGAAETSAALTAAPASAATAATATASDAKAPYFLKGLSISVQGPRLIGVCGRVGSGKSSLFAAALAEMQMAPGGRVAVNGRVALCTQVAWIANATVRENILFGRDWDARWYKQVLHACALEADLAILVAGDETEIGERGINLSGGQKARVALARAIYSRADVYLMDDVLSAVDSHVARHIFEECVLKLLADKLVVFATNQLHILPHFDDIWYLQDGEIVARGVYNDVLAANDSFRSLVAEFESEVGTQQTNKHTHKHTKQNNPHVLLKSAQRCECRSPPCLHSISLTLYTLVGHAISPLPQQAKVKARGDDGAASDATKAADAVVGVAAEKNPAADNTTTGGKALIGKVLIVDNSVSKTDDRHTHGLGMQIDATLKVTFVGEGGQAIGGGIEKGDVITKMGDEIFVSGHQTDVEAVAALTAAKAAGKDIVVEFNGGVAVPASADNTTAAAAAAAADAADRIERKAKGKIVSEETRESGTVDREIWMRYYGAMGKCSFKSAVAVNLLALAVTIFADNWVGVIWAVDAFDTEESFYRNWFILLVFIALVTSCIAAVLVQLVGLMGAANIFKGMLNTVFYLPLSFFESVPSGRVINRFSRDTDLIDQLLPMNLENVLRMFGFGFCILSFIVSSFPPFFIFLIPVTWIYYQVAQFYRPSARDCQRLESVTRSPIFNRFQESLNGTSTIKAFGETGRFIADNDEKLDRNQRTFWAQRSTERWLGVWLEILANVVIAVTALLAVATKDVYTFKSDEDRQRFAARAGVTLAYTFQISFVFNWGLRMLTELETRMNSVERIVEYTDKTREAPPVIEGQRPPAGWPSEGKLVVKNLSMRYRAATPLILRSVSFAIEPRQKVGICGRTGSGKSSLFVCLLRLIEYEEGEILVDGVNLKQMGLSDLRSRITIIPQDPILFEGTVKSNLDPFEESSDEQLLAAVHKVELIGAIHAAVDQGQGGAADDDKGGSGAVKPGLYDCLDAVVEEGGSNYSVGQRQLFCVARALLRSPRLLLMDEGGSIVSREFVCMHFSVYKASLILSPILLVLIAHSPFFVAP
jgi:ABC-type multidrug transport system fused ATPase/permease subunit